MTVRATKFTPHVLASAPRRSSGVPNSDCSAILYTLSTYSLETHSETTELRVLNVASGTSTLLTSEDGVKEPNWLGREEDEEEDEECGLEHSILVLSLGCGGSTKFIIGDVRSFEESKYTVGSVDGTAGSMKLVKLSSDKFIIAFSAKTKPNGDMYNPHDDCEPLTSGRLYDKTFVRHWDQWITENCNSIWYSTISRGSAESKFTMSAVKNALAGTGLESPIPPFGGKDNYDLSKSGLVFVAKEPKSSNRSAFNTKSNVYLIPFTSTGALAEENPLQISVPNFRGASTSPVFSPDSQQIAFLSMRENGYEADKNHLFVIPNVHRPFWVVHCMPGVQGEGCWDRSPESICWSRDSLTLYLTAEDQGRNCLYSLFAASLAEQVKPKKLTSSGSVSEARPLASGQVFLSGSSLVENSWYSLLEPPFPEQPKLISANLHSGDTICLSDKQVSQIVFMGAKGLVQAWVIKPSNFIKNSYYPLAMFVHGGPQGSWLDSWSTRWNPSVFAEQGYIVVAPNITGSTGFGRQFQDSIQNNWGSLPYEDLVKCFDFVKENLSYADTSHAVLLGASYGGYMVNWVQGQSLGRRFKALVCHDGIFSTGNMASTDELYFPEHEFTGKYWRKRGLWLKHDPSKHIGNWETPQLVIHSERDFRIPISDGLAAYNVLQSKRIESQLLVFPDENHWVLKPENSVYWHTVVLNWINKHVGLPPYGVAEPIASTRKKVTRPAKTFADTR